VRSGRPALVFLEVITKGEPLRSHHGIARGRTPDRSPRDCGDEHQHAAGARDGPIAELLADAEEQLKHIVVIYQENWSFDALYGCFRESTGWPV